MRRILLFIASICLLGKASAQSPNWQVNASQYNYSMVVVGLVKADGSENTNANDKVGAFIHGEVRGVATPVFEKKIKRNIFYLIVHHNDDIGNVSFKYYDAQNNTVTAAVQTVAFSVDGLIGDAYKPFVWSNRDLRSQADILKFSLPGQLGSKIYNDSVLVRVHPDMNLTGMVADFTLAEGASLSIGDQRQTTGVTQNDFNAPIILTVRSEDEQHVKEYTLRVREERDEIPNVLFPNGSDLNRTWGMAHLGTDEPVKITVFDENGRILFKTTNPKEEWDGRHGGKYVPEGTYFYVIQREDGTKHQGSIQMIY